MPGSEYDAGPSGHSLQELSGKNWITLPKFCVLVGKSYPTVLKWVHADPPLVKAVRVGGQWRIYEDEVRRFLREGNRS